MPKKIKHLFKLAKKKGYGEQFLAAYELEYSQVLILRKKTLDYMESELTGGAYSEIKKPKTN